MDQDPKVEIIDGRLIISIGLNNLLRFSEGRHQDAEVFAHAVKAELELEDDNNKTLIDELFEVATEEVTSDDNPDS